MNTTKMNEILREIKSENLKAPFIIRKISKKLILKNERRLNKPLLSDFKNRRSFLIQ